MALRRYHRYLAAGLAWALLLGPSAAILVFSFAAGASWLWLFGDDVWPQYTQWILPLVAILASLAVAAICVAVAIMASRERDRRSQPIGRRERQALWLMTAIPLVLMGVAAGVIAKEAADYERAMALATEREAAFAALMGARHRIEAVDVEPIAGGDFQASVRLDGTRAGAYRLEWHIEEPNFGRVLLSGMRTVELGAAAGREIRFEFTLLELAQSYRDQLTPAGGVLVGEDFRLDVLLEPILSETEIAMLPPGESRNLEQGLGILHGRQCS